MKSYCFSFRRYSDKLKKKKSVFLLLTVRCISLKVINYLLNYEAYKKCFSDKKIFYSNIDNKGFFSTS